MVINILNSIFRPFDTIGGLVAFLVSYVLTFFSGIEEFLSAIVFAVIVDAILGVVVSVRKSKKYFRSGRLRDSATKLLIYVILLGLTLMIDKVTCLDSYLAIRAMSVLILLAETYSVIVSFVILCPKSIAGKILKNYMIGEIASKLGKTEDEVKVMLDENKL